MCRGTKVSRVASVSGLDMVLMRSSGAAQPPHVRRRVRKYSPGKMPQVAPIFHRPVSLRTTPEYASPVRAMTHWRVLLDRARSGAENMALDEALLGRARRTGEVVVRLYAWETPTLSLGRNQDARDRYDLARAAALGITFVRRPTGGRAVLHHREITYSVTAPADALGTRPESYARINRLLLEALRALGASAEIAQPAGVAMPPGVAPCFEHPAPGEIMAGGRKLVGSAQCRDDGALLQHGSILVEDDQILSAELLLESHAPPPSAATLRRLTGRAPSLDEAARSFGAAIASLEDSTVAPLALDANTMGDAARLRARYDDPHWTWRR